MKSYYTRAINAIFPNQIRLKVCKRVGAEQQQRVGAEQQQRVFDTAASRPSPTCARLPTACAQSASPMRAPAASMTTVSSALPKCWRRQGSRWCATRGARTTWRRCCAAASSTRRRASTSTTPTTSRALRSRRAPSLASTWRRLGAGPGRSAWSSASLSTTTPTRATRCRAWLPPAALRCLTWTSVRLARVAVHCPHAHQ
jgi:hypothetical protein